MLKDAPPKKPPDNIILPYGPTVQTIKIPIESTEAEANPAQTFIRKLDSADPSLLAPYNYLTKREFKKEKVDEAQKQLDPCDIGLECKQDIEIQDTPEVPEETPETIINWKHKDKIAEAEGKRINPDREWTEGFIPEKESVTVQKEGTQAEVAGTQTKQTNNKYDPMQALIDRKEKPNPNLVCIPQLIRTIKTNKLPKVWQVAAQQKLDKCLATQENPTGWKGAAQKKIKTCLENQTYRKEEREAYQKMMEGLEIIQKEQNKNHNIIRKIETENIELEKEKASENIETNEPNNPEEESITEGQDSYSTHGIMRILINPNKDNAPIDKDDLLNELLEEEELFNTFEKEIEQDLAELEQEKVTNQDISYKVCRCGLKGNRKTGTKCDNDISVADAIQQPTSRIRRVQEKARTDKHKRPVDITSGKPFTWDKYRIGPSEDEPCKVALTQKGECPYMKVTILGHQFEALLDSGAGLSLMSKAAATKLMNSKEWENSIQKQNR